MKIKRYEARSMKDGLEQVKSELGAEAIILSAKDIKSGSGFGGTNQSMVEIIAAKDRLEQPEPLRVPPGRGAQAVPYDPDLAAVPAPDALHEPVAGIEVDIIE